ncbi:fatty-acid amide hydrolase 2-like protein [Dinothrombium tinctorium]|uniref:Fatty-acid amide hydrolase 2-like protein n=1 Tax=Dinothrombium tinctorium TaxID=1965070 RepID=A0A3S3NV73_9ACAR|nr:fatty-acid amide hydrolase 2-like protein [Dinothrombium tinctorium]
MIRARKCFQKVLRFVLDSIAFIIELVIRSKSGRRYLPPIRDPILLQSAVSLSERIKRGKLRSEDVVKAFIARIKEVDPLVNAVVDQRYEDAIKEAQEIDRKLDNIRRGDDDKDDILKLPLLGVPFTGKDSIAIKSLGVTVGLYARRNVKAEEDAVSISNARNAGAIPIALTNVPELCIWYDSENNIYGRTNNPYDLSRIPGGSTGGNAACLTYAGSVIGIGSDIGGSIRMPAYFCGIFGHKTTSGIIDISGHYPDVGPREVFLSFGPMTRYACDLKPFLKALAGDGIKKLPKIDDEVDLKKLKIYYAERSDEAITSTVDAEIVQSIKKVVNYLSETFGCPASEHKFLALEDSFDIVRHTLCDFPCPTIASEMTQHHGNINLELEFLKSMFGLSVHTLPVITIALIEKYTQKSKNNATHDPDYIQMGLRLKEELYSLLGDNGIFIYPCHPIVAPKHKTTILRMENMAYTAIFNLIDVAITQCPIGLNKNGVPLGVQVIATSHNDHLTLAVAEELERAFGGWIPPTDVVCKNVIT